MQNKATVIKRKGAEKAKEAEAGKLHFRNLRCPEGECDFLCKVPDHMLKGGTKGKLRCPVHGKILKTREERGETRGRYMTAA